MATGPLVPHETDRRSLRILVVTYYYPPDRQVGGQRAKKVVEALDAQGHDVMVIAAGTPPARSSHGEATVLRVRPMPSVRDYYAWFHQRFAGRKREDASGTAGSTAGAADTTGSPAAATSPPAATSSFDARVPFWKRWVFSLIWLPDDRQGFIFPTLRRTLLLPGGQPDLIYTTAPPFSVHLAGMLAHVLTGVRWVAEFRDPWTTNPWKPAVFRSRFSDWMEQGLEQMCLERASLLVAVSDGIARGLARTGTSTPITTVRNGIVALRTEDDPPAATAPDAPFEIVYAGSFYHARDPFPFLGAVKQVVAARSLGPADLCIRFIGTTDHYGGRSIGEHVREAGLEAYVRLDGWMRPEACQRHIEAADALLLLALDQPDQVPNKLYEYLGARRPILAVADENGETARMLQQVGGHQLVFTNETANIQRALEALLDGRNRGPVGDLRVLESWTTKAQMAELGAALARHIG